MHFTITHNGKLFTGNFSKPINISIPLKNGTENPKCFYAPNPLFTPVVTDGFIGDTNQGGAVNFYNITYNPHGNGTHTECVGHISKERFYINQCLKESIFLATLISITPIENNGDLSITAAQIPNRIEGNALIIRTLPNSNEKLLKDYSNTNPPYITASVMQKIVALGVQHLLVDLPSVDREQDEGVLAAHHIFWNYPTAPRINATITEMIFVPDELQDGLYLCNIQIQPIELDASNSTIMLYAVGTV